MVLLALRRGPANGRRPRSRPGAPRTRRTTPRATAWTWPSAPWPGCATAACPPRWRSAAYRACRAARCCVPRWGWPGWAAAQSLLGWQVAGSQGLLADQHTGLAQRHQETTVRRQHGVAGTRRTAALDVAMGDIAGARWRSLPRPACWCAGQRGPGCRCRCTRHRPASRPTTRISSCRRRQDQALQVTALRGKVALALPVGDRLELAEGRRVALPAHRAPELAAARGNRVSVDARLSSPWTTNRWCQLIDCAARLPRRRAGPESRRGGASRQRHVSRWDDPDRTLQATGRDPASTRAHDYRATGSASKRQGEPPWGRPGRSPARPVFTRSRHISRSIVNLGPLLLEALLHTLAPPRSTRPPAPTASRRPGATRPLIICSAWARRASMACNWSAATRSMCPGMKLRLSADFTLDLGLQHLQKSDQRPGIQRTGRA